MSADRRSAAWRRRAWALSVPLLLLAVVSGVAWLTRARVTAPPPALVGPGPAPSVLLITVDTLRADRVGAWGGPPGLTPNIDALAAGGTVFAEALASAPLTLPSHATILSGLEPPHHGVRDNGTYVFPQDRETLATILDARGYATGAFIAAYVLDRRFGLARGFDVYDDAVERRDEGPSVLESERRGDAVAQAAEAWIARQKAGPFFAWVHLYDPHAPYDAPAEYRDRHPGQPYDAEVAYADAQVGRVVAAARAVAGERLVVAVLADHGEGLGEHGERTHGFFVYQPTLRVPFVLNGPGIRSRTRLDGVARTADLMPTVLRLLGLAAPAGLDGGDAIRRRSRESYAETHYPRTLGWAPLHSYRAGSWKYVDAPRPELYDLALDPHEARDLATTRPQEATRMRETLARFRQGEVAAAASASDPEVVERLRALGYVAAPPAEGEAETLADPKDRVGLWHRFEDAIWAEARGERDKAQAALRKLVVAEPDNATFRRTLAASLRRSGRAEDAADALGDLEADAPSDPLAWHEQAIAAAAAGKTAEAIRAEQRAIALNPLLPELHNHLGILQSGARRPAEALASFERAAQLDPNNARAWNNRANALRDLGRRAEAADAYRRAAELAPRDPDPRNGLGVLAVEGNDLPAAAAAFREVLKLDSRHHEARMNLAVVLVQLQRPDEARAELRTLLAGKPDRAAAARANAFLKEIR